MTLRHLLVLATVLLGCRSHVNAPAPVAIHWQRFGPAAFEQARRDDKLVMVDAGIEGCTACRWMHEGSYSNPGVIRRIQESFVPVSVDADQEPDLGERFEPWGWPATIFFAPDGKQVFALQGSDPPNEFAALLDQVVARKRAGTLGRGEAVTAHSTEAKTNVSAACADANAALEKMSDEHGWGGEERVALVGPFEHAMIRARAHDDANAAAHALAEAEGEAKIMDPVWGGVFVASFSKAWDNIIPEKRTNSEAAALGSFALELHRTGDAKWRANADLVRKYLEDWMRSPDGTFYSTQQDAAPHLPTNMDASQYYALGDAERRKYGVPPIDHGVYTDQNAMVIQAYLRLYEATGDHAVLAVATRAADAILKNRTRPDGALAQADLTAELAKDQRLRETTVDSRLYLKAQGEMGLALVRLYEDTADPRYLDAALKIAKVLPSLEDATRGDYFGASAREIDTLVSRKKPFVDNVAVARFLGRLGALTREDGYTKAAERTLLALAPASRYEGAWGLGLFALALEELALGPVEVTVVRGSDDDVARSLHEQVVRIYEPRKLVRLEDGGHYPKPKGAAAIYVCTRSECSSPVTSVTEARALVDRMTKQPDPCR